LNRIGIENGTFGAATNVLTRVDDAAETTPHPAPPSPLERHLMRNAALPRQLRHFDEHRRRTAGVELYRASLERWGKAVKAYGIKADF